MIRKLGEKQKMLEKYESMLQKINFEFKNTLNKNKEISNQVSMLEMHLQQANEKANDFQEKNDHGRFALQRKIDELVLEKDQLHSENLRLNKLMSSNKFEIEELNKSKADLENRLMSKSTQDTKTSFQESEYRSTIDELKKRVLELEYDLKRRSEDSKSDVASTSLVTQTLKREVEQLTIQRGDMNEQNLKVKEDLWKANLENRQLKNEVENYKSENNNLKNTVELISDHERELKTENKYLRDSAKAMEKVNVLYQNIIDQNGKYQWEIL